MNSIISRYTKYLAEKAWHWHEGFVAFKHWVAAGGIPCAEDHGDAAGVLVDDGTSFEASGDAELAVL